MTDFVLHSSISVSDNRQRREFDEGALQELITSIEEKGLLNAVVVRKNIAGGFVLVAGERRLRAITELAEFGLGYRYGEAAIDPGWVPIVNIGELPELLAKELELEENIRRSDLTWQERVAAEAELMLLREARGKEVGADRALVRAAAVREIKGAVTPAAITSVTQALILARNLHRPEVSSAKSQTEAYKAMQRVEAKEKNEAMAAAMGKEHLSGKHKLYQQECTGWMAATPSAQFDVICSDPPYGMGADEFGDSNGKMGEGAHFYKDDYAGWAELLHFVMPELFRLSKPDSHMYLFCDFDRFHELKGFAEASGWKVFRTPLIWFKPSAFRAPWPDKGPQRKYECILYAVRGDLKCNHLGGDVIQCAPDENLGHPAQKPVALIKDLLGRSVRAGMHILDPFCGSGPIFEAGHALSAIVTGVEQDPAACGIAATRLAKLGVVK